MTGSFYGLVIESLVAVLLGLTIGYCVVLNRRLQRLRADESSMRGTIAELIAATDSAERAIKNLREITQQTNATLGEGLRASIDVTRDLDDQIARGEEVLGRIVQIAEVAEAARTTKREAANVEPIRLEESQPRSPNRTAQAAQALALRLRAAAAGQAA